ncbi:YcgN family cysteine cluster protein [Thalassolituus sp. LLYu03]|uniref:YcgN family cysteine cluster protein n=1 Tax=Thalassolituus sp. LLYu03 TaxID=3421656 RepID=UPI003D273382
MSAKAFWQEKKLSEMTRTEWESLCDGCALCCLHKLEDEDTGEVYYTDVHCRYLEKSACRCSVYQERNIKVPECVWLTPEQAEMFFWLPPTCAYRLLAEGKPLFDWHPLVSGDPDSVHTAGISLRDKGIPDDQISEDEWQDRIIWKA